MDLKTSAAPGRHDERILTAEALCFLDDLQGRFGARRDDPLDRRID